MSAGKGDKPRPVDKKIYDKNYENIKWGERENTEVKKEIKRNRTRYSY